MQHRRPPPPLFPPSSAPTGPVPPVLCGVSGTAPEGSSPSHGEPEPCAECGSCECTRPAPRAHRRRARARRRRPKLSLLPLLLCSLSPVNVAHGEETCPVPELNRRHWPRVVSPCWINPNQQRREHRTVTHPPHSMRHWKPRQRMQPHAAHCSRPAGRNRCGTTQKGARSRRRTPSALHAANAHERTGCACRCDAGDAQPIMQHRDAVGRGPRRAEKTTCAAAANDAGPSR